VVVVREVNYFLYVVGEFMLSCIFSWSMKILGSKWVLFGPWLELWVWYETVVYNEHCLGSLQNRSSTGIDV